MPRDSKVGRCYDKLVSEGKSEESAAKICQSQTGEALKTGEPSKAAASTGIERLTAMLRSRCRMARSRCRMARCVGLAQPRRF